MCDDEKELEAELQKGTDAAVSLVQHLARMGAAKATIPVTHDGKVFKITVEQVFDYSVY